jgi:hypothetical protein
MQYSLDKMNKVKLRGKLKGTASWVEIKPDGGLQLEFFDYSEDAQAIFGHDIAYLIQVSEHEKSQVMAFLNIVDDKLTLPDLTLPDLTLPDLTHPDLLLLERIEESFEDYFECKEWLDAHGVSYQKEFDAMA